MAELTLENRLLKKSATADDQIAGDQLVSAKSRGTAQFLSEPSYLTRLRRTVWLGRRDSNLCISIYWWPFYESKEFPDSD